MTCRMCGGSGEVYRQSCDVGEPTPGGLEPCPACDGTGSEMPDLDALMEQDLELEEAYGGRDGAYD